MQKKVLALHDLSGFGRSSLVPIISVLSAFGHQCVPLPTAVFSTHMAIPGWVKSDLISKFYIDATDECPDVREVLALSEKVGAISAYAYLGDVGDSVTGDKRAQKFEDDFLDELVPFLAGLGYRAITYMPSRNTPAQLKRIRALCDKYGLFQISGEDINSPRQSFVCEAQRAPEFANLYEATWALIAHEWRSTKNPADGLFSKESVAQWPALSERVKAFSAFGQEMFK